VRPPSPWRLILLLVVVIAAIVWVLRRSGAAG
jgi:F0F1-type ATP synthase assembly protein I